MRISTLLLTTIISAHTVSSAAAADPGQIFGTIVQELGRQIERKQASRRYQQLERLWNGCFAGKLAQCERALATPGYAYEQRVRLAEQRAVILEEHRSRVDRRLCLGASDLAACDRLLASSSLPYESRQVLQRHRDAIVEDMRDTRALEVEEQAGPGIILVDQASASEQPPTKSKLKKADPEPLIAGDVPEPQPVKREVAETPVIEVGASSSLPLSLPTSTVIATSIATLLALALSGLLVRFRHQLLPAPAGAALLGPWSRSGPRHQEAVMNLMPGARRSPAVARMPAGRGHPRSLAARDTRTAVAALELANAYLEEAERSHTDAIDDEALRADTLNTLSLAARQLEIARQADPDAALEITTPEGEAIWMTQQALRAEALFLEGACHVKAKPRKAIAILERAAAITPDNARIHFWIGTVNIDLLHKRRAIDAFTRAFELEPDNIVFRKSLDRARTMSNAAVAVRRTTDLASLARLVLWSWWTVGVACLLVMIGGVNRIETLAASAALYVIAFLGVRAIRIYFNWFL